MPKNLPHHCKKRSTHKALQQSVCEMARVGIGHGQMTDERGGGGWGHPNEANGKVIHLLISQRAALHLQAGPIRCVRGLKSSLVTGSNRSQCLSTYRLDRFGGMNFFITKCMLCHGPSSLNGPKMCMLCTQNGGSILGLKANVIFQQKTLLKKVWFFLAN